MILDEVLKKYPQKEECLIELLLDYQSQKSEKFISEEEIVEIANHLQISESRVCSVITFYTLLSIKPRGKHIIQVCKDIPCYVSNGTDVLKTLEILGIKVGETTANKQFTLEYASCLGCCDKAPAMRIDGKTFTNLTPDKIKAIISEYRGK